MKKLLLGLGTLAAVVAPVTVVVACSSNASDRKTITIEGNTIFIDDIVFVSDYFSGDLKSVIHMSNDDSIDVRIAKEEVMELIKG